MAKNVNKLFDVIHKEWKYWAQHRPIGGIIYLFTFIIILLTMLYAFFTQSQFTPHITAVFIALLTFIGVVLTVSYKVKVEVKSKNRQEWINDLRKNMGEFLDLYYKLDLNNLRESKDPKVITQNIMNDINKMLSIYQYVLLLISNEANTSNDEETKKFITALELAIQDASTPPGTLELDEQKLQKIQLTTQKVNTLGVRVSFTNTLSTFTQILLKKEWEKVKNGD